MSAGDDKKVGRTGRVSGAANRWLGALYESSVRGEPMVQQAVERFRSGETTRQAFREAFVAFVAQCEQDLRAEMATFEDDVRKASEQGQAVLDEFREEIVTFLVQAQPGPLSDVARMILRDKAGLLEKLEWKVTDLNDAVVNAWEDR